MFTPLKPAERRQLNKALRKNIDDDVALLVDKDTSFIGTTDETTEIGDNEVVFAIKSIPCHY